METCFRLEFLSIPATAWAVLPDRTAEKPGQQAPRIAHSMGNETRLADPAGHCDQSPLPRSRSIQCHPSVEPTPAKTRPCGPGLRNGVLHLRETQKLTRGRPTSCGRGPNQAAQHHPGTSSEAGLVRTKRCMMLGPPLELDQAGARLFTVGAGRSGNRYTSKCNRRRRRSGSPPRSRSRSIGQRLLECATPY